MFKKTVAGATLGATTLLWASPASAQDLDSAPQAVVDNLWLVVAGALVVVGGSVAAEVSSPPSRVSHCHWPSTLVQQPVATESTAIPLGEVPVQ